MCRVCMIILHQFIVLYMNMYINIAYENTYTYMSCLQPCVSTPSVVLYKSILNIIIIYYIVLLSSAAPLIIFGHAAIISGHTMPKTRYRKQAWSRLYHIGYWHRFPIYIMCVCFSSHTARNPMICILWPNQPFPRDSWLRSLKIQPKTVLW